ncbi:CLUMA_CG010596, isoform A [Clunio marinus]|uniref:CLUMA_CG010596, isoform A n=1 Tax=Clunio marinus TaxID=568069 RepID=A0A1J1IA85_9DIPT|nr:CLUMA_CG010596, isoform A [Clunio marinus]
MLKIAVLFTLVAVTIAGVIHEYSGDHAGGEGQHYETEHHHEVNHKNAESHQSVKFIHFHAVPVYVKKEDQKYLHHPVEIGSNKHKLKLIHPETEHAKGHGLTLENHSEHQSHKVEYPHEEHHVASEGGAHEQSYEVQPEFDFAAYEAAHH